MAVNAYSGMDGTDARFYSPSVTAATILSSSSGIGSSLTSSSATHYNNHRPDSYKSSSSNESKSYKGNYKPIQSNVDYHYSTAVNALEHHQPTNLIAQADAEDMNMKFADLTHMQLKRSVDQHNQQSDIIQRSYLPSSYTNTNGFSSNPRTGSTSPRTDTSRSSNGGITSEYEYLDKCSKYQNIIAAKNAILDEKEAQIVKLRSQLNVQSLSGGSSPRSYGDLPNKPFSGLSLTTSRSDNDVSNPYQGQGMRVQLAETFAQQEKEINNLQNLLGKTEFELSRVKDTHQHELKMKNEKIQELEFSIKAKDKTLEKLTNKQKELLEMVEKYKRRGASLERYLSDLPTVEESQELKRSNDNLNNIKRNLKMELENYKEKVNLLQQEMQSKEEQMHTKAMTNIELENKIKDLDAEIMSYKDSETELGLSERKEYQNILLELEALKKEREEAARVLAAADNKMKDLNSQYMKEMNGMKDRIEEEEGTVKSLRLELSAKQQNSLKIQTTMTQLSSQNQQLMEEKLSLMEKLRNREGERNINRHTSRMNSRLHREIQTAVQDLQNVTDLLLQSAKGDDPNLSALVGIRPSAFGVLDDDGESGSKTTTTGTSDSSDADNDMTVEAIKKKLSQVRKLRKDIDELRSNLSNKYAENIGQNCATQ